MKASQTKKFYRIESAGRDPEYVRGTAKSIQIIIRQLHADGIQASMKKVINKAEMRIAKASLAPAPATW